MHQKTRKKTEKRKKYPFLVGGSVFLTAAVCLILFYFVIYRVEPTFQTMTYELGERVSRDAGDYLSGTDWSVNLGEVDLSGVDRRHAGTYEAVVHHGRKDYCYSIVIEDTVAPEILPMDAPVYLAAGRDCTVGDVVRGIRDEDEEATVCFCLDGRERETVSFSETGVYTVEVRARDGAGNQTFAEISVTVDTAPAIEGVLDFYVALGSCPDYLAGITAVDDVDGNLTESVSVDDSQVDLLSEGEYTLLYSAEDSYGLVTEERARVTVLSEEEVQELIGERQIDRRSFRIIGAANPYDGGAGETNDLSYELHYMLPAMVQLYHEVPGGYNAGSGYIMEITDDTVYICSNEHVVGNFKEWDVYFYDGTVVKGKQLGTSESYDVGVVVVEKEDVPPELSERLMTVHINQTYWETLDEDDIEVGLARVDRQGGVFHTSEGWLVKIKQQFAWYGQKNHTEITARLMHGDSGSAVLDGHGNLIAMAYAYSGSPARYWCIPLDAILDCYEEITGRTPYVY